MSDWKEYVAKSVSEALTNALIEMETTSDNVEYEVIEKEKSGFLGFGSKQAKIKVRLKDKEEETIKEKKKEPLKKSEPVKEKAVVKEEKPKTAVKEKKEYEKEPARESISKELTEEDIQNLENTAKSFLVKVFSAMKIEVAYDITFDRQSNTINIDLSGNEMGILIGKRGQTLDSLQYLVSLVVNKESDNYIKVKVDTENYRQRRRETLENLAVNISHKVKRTKRSVILEPMNPYERRIIHSALQGDKYVETHSEGEEPYRKVVVTLKKEYRDYNGSRNGRGRYSGYNNRRYNRDNRDSKVSENDTGSEME